MWSYDYYSVDGHDISLLHGKEDMEKNAQYKLSFSANSKVFKKEAEGWATRRQRIRVSPWLKKCTPCAVQACKPAHKRPKHQSQTFFPNQQQ